MKVTHPQTKCGNGKKCSGQALISGPLLKYNAYYESDNELTISQNSDLIDTSTQWIPLRTDLEWICSKAFDGSEILIRLILMHFRVMLTQRRFPVTRFP